MVTEHGKMQLLLLLVIYITEGLVPPHLYVITMPLVNYIDKY